MSKRVDGFALSILLTSEAKRINLFVLHTPFEPKLLAPRILTTPLRERFIFMKITYDKKSCL